MFKIWPHPTHFNLFLNVFSSEEEEEVVEETKQEEA